MITHSASRYINKCWNQRCPENNPETTELISVGKKMTLTELESNSLRGIKSLERIRGVI